MGIESTKVSKNRSVTGTMWEDYCTNDEYLAIIEDYCMSNPATVDALDKMSKELAERLEHTLFLLQSTWKDSCPENGQIGDSDVRCLGI